MNRFWNAVGRWAALVTIVGTLALLILGGMALFWAQRTFRQMELDFRFTSPADQQTIRGVVIVDGVFSGQQGDFSVALDGSEIDRLIPFALNTLDLADGTHTLSVHIQRGDITTRVAAVVFAVDNTPPVISISRPEEGAAVSGTVNVEFEVRGARQDIQPTLILDGVARETLSTINSATLQDGPHYLAIQAEDDAGNVREELVWFEVDNTPPRIETLGIESGASIRGVVELTPVVAERNVEGVSWTLNSVEVGDDLSLFIDTRELEEGEVLLQLTVWDRGGGRDSLEASATVDNTPPSLRWVLPNRVLSTVYRGQRIPLGITSEPGASIAVSANGELVAANYLDLSEYQLGEVIRVEASAADRAGNVETLATELQVATDLQSRLATMGVVGRILGRALSEPLRLLLSAFDASRPSFSFEYCPPTSSPYWLGCRVGIDLPVSELYARVLPVPGFGFSVPLGSYPHAHVTGDVPMVPRLGFGYMGTGRRPTGGPTDADRDAIGGLEDLEYRSANSVYAELLFCWDLTPIMARDYTEVSLGFRVGLTDVVSYRDESVAHKYTPAAALVFRVKGFFW